MCTVKEDDVLKIISIVEDIIARKAREIRLSHEVSVFNLRSRLASVLLQYSVVTKGRLIYERKQERTYRRNFENFIKSEYFDFIPIIKGLRSSGMAKQQSEYFSKIETANACIKKLDTRNLL